MKEARGVLDRTSVCQHLNQLSPSHQHNLFKDSNEEGSMEQNEKDPGSPKAHPILPASQYVRHPAKEEVGFEEADKQGECCYPKESTGDLHSYCGVRINCNPDSDRRTGDPDGKRDNVNESALGGGLRSATSSLALIP